MTVAISYDPDDDAIMFQCVDCRRRDETAKGASTARDAIAAFLNRERWRMVENNRLVCADCAAERERRRLIGKIGDWIRRRREKEAENAAP